MSKVIKPTWQQELTGLMGQLEQHSYPKQRIVRPLYLYMLTQSVNDEWEATRTAVVVAESEEGARQIHPSLYFNQQSSFDSEQAWEDEPVSQSWAPSPADVIVTLIGTADRSLESGAVVCVSCYGAKS